MIKRAGTSILLSFSIVALAVVVLSGPTSRTGNETGTRRSDTRLASARSQRGDPTPGIPWTLAPEPASAVLVQHAAAGAGEPVRPSKSSYTTVREGERLADIALRVYGDPAAVERLRAANRDQLPDSETLPMAGSLLRTP